MGHQSRDGTRKKNTNLSLLSPSKSLLASLIETRWIRYSLRILGKVELKKELRKCLGMKTEH